MEVRELTASYLRYRKNYRDLVVRAAKISRGSGGIYVEGNQLDYASIIFTRIVVVAKTIENNLPLCKPKEHWDFSSVASLARNLAEAYLWYFWLCEDDIDPDIRQGRFILLYLHDHGSRGRLTSQSPAEGSAGQVYADLERRFDENPYLKTYDHKQRKEALKGHKTPFIQDDVLDRMNADRDDFRMYYRFFSQHTHSGPISFFRIREHDRGTGVETVVEKKYMMMAIEFASEILSRAIAGHLKLFPDAETRKPTLTAMDSARNVELAQGRAEGVPYMPWVTPQ